MLQTSVHNSISLELTPMEVAEALPDTGLASTDASDQAATALVIHPGEPLRVALQVQNWEAHPLHLTFNLSGTFPSEWCGIGIVTDITNEWQIIDPAEIEIPAKGRWYGNLIFRVIPAPEDLAAVYRDDRWVEIQPGIAIDVAGNLIVIQRPIPFRIATELKDTQPLTVYLVAKYRDPDDLNNQNSTEIVEETFRIDEKTSPSDSLEVELCRILLHVDKRAITQPKDVFFPGYADLDLRYRRQAQARPQGFVRLAQVNSDDPECSQNFFNLTYLLQALEALYPQLRSANTVDQVNWDGDLGVYDLLYLTGQQGLSLNAPQYDAIAAYLKHGGTLLIDAPQEATALIYSTHALANKLNTPLKSLKEARRDHHLRTRPFLFAALPVVNQHMLQLLTGGGIILTIGNVGATWGLDEALSLPRTTIRTAQELGINILYYAWKRRQLTSLLQEESVL